MIERPAIPVPKSRRNSRAAHWIAWSTAAAVFPLIIVGAGVTSNDAGMAYPDWPTSNGHVVNPPHWWQSLDTRLEHGHRLIGWVVGMLAIALAVMTWRRGGWVRLLGIGTLLAIGIQGVLGGLRVTQISVGLAMLHGIWGQVCFCLACMTAFLSSRTFNGDATVCEVRSGAFLRRLCLAATISVFIQLLLGSAQRHFASDATLIAHVFFAIVVCFLVGWVVVWLMGQGSDPVMARLAAAAGVLIALQLVLGGSAFLMTVAGDSFAPVLVWAVPTAHVAAGALLLACMVLLTIASFTLIRPLPASGEVASRVFMAT